jgi:DNA adenine methylase
MCAISPTLTPRPFLKWAGGKSQLLAQYKAHFPLEFDRYYEPFLGGGAVFFHLRPPQAMLSDINPELVNVYQCVRDQVEAIAARLEAHQQQHGKAYYYQVRSQHQGSAIERAARLIYLNKTCFNGLYRENSRGEFNVPMGRYKNPRIYDPDLLQAASAVLQATEIKVRSFEVVLQEAQTSRDFVYFDPPYYPLNATSNFTAYSRYTFGQAEQIRLQQAFQHLAERGVNVMLSNSDCAFIHDLYQNYCIHRITAPRAINSNPQKRGKITELLITSYASAGGEGAA